MTKEEFIKKIKEINVTVPDEYFFLEYNKCVYDILKENEKLKKEVELKHDGFMASIDDVCEYAKENDKLRSVIDNAIDYLENTTMVADSYYHQRACLLNILKRGCNK